MKKAFAVAFSLLYLASAPILLGRFVFYYYPAFSVATTTLYVLIGIGLQVIVYLKSKSLALQGIVGVLYLFAPLLKAHLYQS